MWFWKNNKKKKPVLISHDEHRKLPDHLQQHFERHDLPGFSPTHRVADDENGFGLYAHDTADEETAFIAGEMLGTVIENAIGETDQPQAAENQFGGGDGGGAGATGTWDDSPSADNGNTDSGMATDTSNDTSSSADSSSSSDSTSSSDN